MQKRVSEWGLPLALIAGGAGYKFFSLLAPVIPSLIFSMLLLTYCRISWEEMKIRRLHLWLLAIQLLGSLVVYGLVRIADPIVAQGMFLCILAPTATAAAVITGMLGGSVTTLVTYTLISNLAVAIASPILFSFIGIHVEQPFLESFLLIARQVVPLLIFPLLGGWLFYKFIPGAYRTLQKWPNITFYLWIMALTIVMGRTVSMLIAYERTHFQTEVILALGALLICVAQFLTGRRMGRHFGDTVAGGQGLGQKNTVLAIWMAGIYLDPLASLGPAAYIIWQNIVNSGQLWWKSYKSRMTH